MDTLNRQGIVTAVGPPLRVRLDADGADIVALRLASYVPAVGDRIVLDQWGPQWIVLGKVAT